MRQLIILLTICIIKSFSLFSQERITDLETYKSVSNYNDFDELLEYNGETYFLDDEIHSIDMYKIENGTSNKIWGKTILYPESRFTSLLTSNIASIKEGFIYSVKDQNVTIIDLTNGDTIDIIELSQDTTINYIPGYKDTRYIYEYGDYIYIDTNSDSGQSIVQYNVTNNKQTTLNINTPLHKCIKYRNFLIYYDTNNNIYNYNLDNNTLSKLNETTILQIDFPLSGYYHPEENIPYITYIDNERKIFRLNLETMKFMEICHSINETDTYITSKVFESKSYILSHNNSNEIILNIYDTLNCNTLYSSIISSTSPPSSCNIYNTNINSEPWIIFEIPYENGYIMDKNLNIFEVQNTDFFSTSYMKDLIQVGDEYIYPLCGFNFYDDKYKFIKYDHLNKRIEFINFNSNFDYGNLSRIKHISDNQIATGQIYNESGHFIGILSNTIGIDTLISVKPSHQVGIFNIRHKLIYNDHLVFNYGYSEDENIHIIHDNNIFKINNKYDLNFKIRNDKYQYFTTKEIDIDEFYIFNNMSINSGFLLATNTNEKVKIFEGPTIILNAEFYKDENYIDKYDILNNKFINIHPNFPLKDALKYKHIAINIDGDIMQYYNAASFKVESQILSKNTIETEILPGSNNHIPIKTCYDNTCELQFFNINTENFSEIKIPINVETIQNIQIFNDSLAIYSFYNESDQKLQCIIGRNNAFNQVILNEIIIDPKREITFNLVGDKIFISQSTTPNFHYYINTNNEAINWIKDSSIDYRTVIYASLYDSTIYETYSPSLGETFINTYDMSTMELKNSNIITGYSVFIETFGWYYRDTDKYFFLEEKNNIYIILHTPEEGNEVRKIDKSNLNVVESWNFKSGSASSKAEALTFMDSTAYFLANSDQHGNQWYKIENIIDPSKAVTQVESPVDSIDSSLLMMFSPNPTNESIKISKELKWISIYNMEGKLVAQEFNISKNQAISLDNLSNGLYLIEYMTLDGKLETQKIVKTNR